MKIQYSKDNKIKEKRIKNIFNSIISNEEQKKQLINALKKILDNKVDVVKITLNDNEDLIFFNRSKNDNIYLEIMIKNTDKNGLQSIIFDSALYMEKEDSIENILLFLAGKNE